jgi:hypothetical protein
MQPPCKTVSGSTAAEAAATPKEEEKDDPELR